MNRDIIIALDFPDEKQTLQFLDLFENTPLFVKVGLELFYSEGTSIIEEIKSRGHKIFLDLKLHDIPNTVKGGMRSLSNLGVDIVNVHASGTIEMMKAAVEGATREDGSRPLIIAVTQLTSTSEKIMQDELMIHTSIENSVKHLAKNTLEAGLDGVVCSPLETPIVKKECGNNFITVTPGIRFNDDPKGDQVRITTPLNAHELQTNYIVVGRSITNAHNPVEAYNRCYKNFIKGEV